MAGGTWTSLQQVGGKARDTINLNVITGPEETHDTGDYRTLIDSSLVHLWTDKLSSTVNGDWATESGAAPGGGQANWYGVAHYLTYTFNDYVSATCARSGLPTTAASASGGPETFTRTPSA